MNDLSNMARWVLGIAATVTVLFLGFIGSTVVHSGERLARIEEQLKDADAASTQASALAGQILALQTRVDRLESERRERWRQRREEREGGRR